jgi:translation initiation factor IF-2
MNSGKVRIYELSKELNLDNKDILAICERLDIAVKSHSSTIAETEADQIRAAAETARQQPPSQRPDRPRPHLAKMVARPEQKQQILEIRRHRVTPRPDLPVESEVEIPVAGSGAIAKPQRPSGETALPPPRRGPVQPGGAEPPKPKPVIAATRPGPAPSPADMEASPAAVAPPGQRPRLTGPPARAAMEDSQDLGPTGGGATTLEPPRLGRPVIKRVDSRSPDSAPGAPARATIPIREVDGDEPSLLLKPKPKLRRPEPPGSEAKETEAKDRTTTAEDSISVLGAAELDLEGRLRRPSDPRL